MVVFTYFNRQKSKSPPRSAQSSCGPAVASSKYLEPKWLVRIGENICKIDDCLTKILHLAP